MGWPGIRHLVCIIYPREQYEITPTMTTFEQVVEKVKQFSPEQRKMLTHLIKKWEIEAVRHEIARDAKDSLQQFRQGNLRPQSAQSVIRELRESPVETE
jgi:hypothetical protein